MRTPHHVLPARLLLVGALVASPVLVAPGADAAAVPRGSAILGTDVATAARAAVEDRSQRSVATTKRGRSAVRWALHKSRWPARTCMVFVRSALRVGPRYSTPRVAWAAAKRRHRTAYRDIPAGVPVYSAGRTAPGHIALSVGGGRGRSTDWPRTGHVGTVSLRKLLRSWGHRYLGWSADLNGVRVWHR